VRLFVALEVPEPVRDPLDGALAEVRRRWDGLRWNPPEQWHLTLAFIGHVDDEVDDVVSALAPAAEAAPTRIGLTLGAPGRFGQRVLWMGIDDEPEDAVSTLGAATQRALSEAGLPVDDKPVHPHVTLARSRRRGGARIRPDVVEAVPPVDATWSVGELVLYESVQRGRGEPNRYVARARVPFAG
jgi:RNA 2',3'-cyclic 3'-phosphodiesterase